MSASLNPRRPARTPVVELPEAQNLAVPKGEDLIDRGADGRPAGAAASLLTSRDEDVGVAIDHVLDDEPVLVEPLEPLREGPKDSLVTAIDARIGPLGVLEPFDLGITGLLDQRRERSSSCCLSRASAAPYSPLTNSTWWWSPLQRVSGLVRATAFRPKRLLRQPDGFEGLLVIPEELHKQRLALSDGEDHSAHQISLESRPIPGNVRSRADDHDVICIDQVLDHAVVAHRFRKPLPEGAHFVLSVIDMLRPTLCGSKYHIVVPKLGSRVEVAPVPVLQRLDHEFDVR